VIDRWEAVEEKALTPQSINLIEAALRRGGLDPEAFSAHGLRAGYRAEAAQQRMGLPEAMQQSQHRFGPGGPRAITMRPSARWAARLGLKGNCQLTISCHPIAADDRRVEG
jgi:hypothetical protein